MPLRLLCSTLVLTLVAACTESLGPEAQIRAEIAAMEEALAERNPREFLAPVATSFSGGGNGSGHMTRDDAKRMLGVYLLRYRNVGVLLSGVSVDIDPYQDGLASFSARAALTGGQGLIPESARLYQLRGQWQNFDGDWKLVRLHWE